MACSKKRQIYDAKANGRDDNGFGMNHLVQTKPRISNDFIISSKHRPWWESSAVYPDYNQPQTAWCQDIGNLQHTKENPSIRKQTTHLHMIMRRTKSGSRCHPRRHKRIRLAASFHSYHALSQTAARESMRGRTVEHQASSQHLTREPGKCSGSGWS